MRLVRRAVWSDNSLSLPRRTQFVAVSAVQWCSVAEFCSHASWMLLTQALTRLLVLGACFSPKTCSFGIVLKLMTVT